MLPSLVIELKWMITPSERKIPVYPTMLSVADRGKVAEWDM